MLRPLLMMRTRGLGVHFQKVANLKNHIARSVGPYIGLDEEIVWPEDVSFISAFRGEDDTQNINLDGTICNLMPLGTVAATMLHSAPILAPDYLGGYQEYAIDAPVWRGGRFIKNLALWSEDGTNAVYSKLRAGSGVAPATTAVPGGGPNGRDATRVIFDIGSGVTSSDQSRLNQNVGHRENVPLAFSFWAKSNDANDYTIRVDFNGATPSEGDLYPVFGQTWARYEYLLSDTGTTVRSPELRLRGHFPTSKFADVLISGWQVEEAAQVGEYIPTTDVKEVVTYSTDSAGNPLNPHPWLQTNEAATNSIWPSADFGHANWTVANGAVLGAADTIDGEPCYNLHFDTAGLSALRSANAVYTLGAPNTLKARVRMKTGTGAVRLQTTGNSDHRSANIPIDDTRWHDVEWKVASVNATGAGSRIINSSDGVAQDIYIAWMMSTETYGMEPYIPTTTVAAPIPAVASTYPALNIDPASAEIKLRIDWAGDDTDVIDIGLVKLLSITAGQLTLSDGTNSVQLPITEGATNDIKVSLTATTMELDLNAAVAGGPYVPVASGDIVLSETAWALRSTAL